MRHLLGLSHIHQRAPWPEALPLPRLRWLLLLDGLDESPLPSQDTAEVLNALATHVTLLVSCRLNDHARYLETGASSFAIYVELTPWDDEQLERYASALEASGRQSAAFAVRRLMVLHRRPDVIGYPLWLSMLTYLAENEASVEVEQLDDYELVRQTMRAVAINEILRAGGDRADAGALEGTWQQAAWLLHERRRTVSADLVGQRPRAGRVSLRDLEELLETPRDAPAFRAMLSLLDIGDEVVKGFRHEVLHDYWLGEYIAQRLPGANAGEVANLLGRQRRAFANDAVRRRLASEGREADAAATLRGCFSDIPHGPADIFVKNQMLYFLGRLDDSSASQQFLASVWQSQESDFVRYSAAFTGAMMGAAEVENDYFGTLTKDADSDALNRGYHLFYHGDVDVPESAMPYYDDGSASPDRSIEVLVERLQRSGPGNRRLRRIELFTLRRSSKREELQPLTWPPVLRTL